MKKGLPEISRKARLEKPTPQAQKSTVADRYQLRPTMVQYIG
jgi:hypothetical protein